jgi:transposase
VFVGPGRDADTIAAFADHIEAHGGDASHIKQVSIDMSAAFVKGVTDNLTEAEITFDRFHVMKLIGDAVDQVRRAEVKQRPELKGSRYAWSKNAANLTAGQTRVIDQLSSTNLKTARAWRMRLAFQDIYARYDRVYAERLLERWIGWAKRSRLEPMKAVARTIERHWHGILAFFDSRISNGLIEGINSLVQAAKAKARGYRSVITLTAMTYLVAGKLDLKLPT